MRHDVYVDDDNKIMVMRIKGDFTLEDAKKCLDTLIDQIGDRGAYPMLIDLTDAPPRLDKEVRNYLKAQNEDRKISKQAFVITNPAVRMVAKIMVATQDSAESVMFFKTEEEALVWLKGE